MQRRLRYLLRLPHDSVVRRTLVVMTGRNLYPKGSQFMDCHGSELNDLDTLAANRTAWRYKVATLVFKKCYAVPMDPLGPLWMMTRLYYCISVELKNGHWMVNMSNCKELWILLNSLRSMQDVHVVGTCGMKCRKRSIKRKVGVHDRCFILLYQGGGQKMSGPKRTLQGLGSVGL